MLGGTAQGVVEKSWEVRIARRGGLCAWILRPERQELTD